MARSRIVRSILALTLIAGVSACQSTGMPVSEAPAPSNSGAAATTASGLQVPTLMKGQKAQAPVDLVALRDSYFAANPDQTAVELDGVSYRGLRFMRDGRVFFDGGGSRGDMNIPTSVNYVSGNKLCVEPSGSWSGMCIEVFKTGDGRLKVYYKYGNGPKGKYVVKNIKV